MIIWWGVTQVMFSIILNEEIKVFASFLQGANILLTDKGDVKLGRLLNSILSLFVSMSASLN